MSEITDLPTEAIVEGVRGFRTPIVVGMCMFSAIGGAAIGFEIARRRLATKYSKIADDEIASMREHYREKAVALENQAGKPDLENIVTEKGYTTHEGPPMAVQPPETVVSEEDDEEEDESKYTDKPPILIKPATPEPNIPKLGPIHNNVFKEANKDWDWHEERRRRSPDIPYVVHVDEIDEMDYQKVTLTYYEVDDVLCNQQDEIVDPDFEREKLVGEKNLEKFGHGSNDESVVYVRNDTLEITFEILKAPTSFAEEVHGFTHEGYSRGNLERMRARERDDPDE